MSLSSQASGTFDAAGNDRHWIELNDAKSFSRLLYPNPVVFLTSWCRPNVSCGASPLAESPQDQIMEEINNNSEESSPRFRRGEFTKNVMTLSWISPINNSGQFIFSVNRRRHTALAGILVNRHENMQRREVLDEDDCPGNLNGDLPQNRYFEFVLSVPVKGMEEIVWNVGKASGRFGSKFPEDYEDVNEKNVNKCDYNSSNTALYFRDEGEGSIKRDNVHNGNQQSDEEKRGGTKKKSSKRKSNLFDRGVPHLCAVPMGKRPSTGPWRKLHIDEPFAIAGTIAHMQCQLCSIINQDFSNHYVDDDHLLCIAIIKKAFVDSSYWDARKKIFRPLDSNTMPYLSFFGSQTFGYVKPM